MMATAGTARVTGAAGGLAHTGAICRPSNTSGQNRAYPCGPCRGVSAPRTARHSAVASASAGSLAASVRRRVPITRAHGSVAANAAPLQGGYPCTHSYAYASVSTAAVAVRRRRRGSPCHAAESEDPNIVAGIDGRNRRTIRRFSNALEPNSEESAADADAASLLDTPSEAVGAGEERPSDDARADASFASEETSEQQAAMRATGIGDLNHRRVSEAKRKRRVLKVSTTAPTTAPALWDMVFVQEGNVPAAPTITPETALPRELEEIARRGYISKKHSMADARDRVAFQMESLGEFRKRRGKVVAQQTSGVTEAGAGVVIDADKDETAIAMEKAKAKAQKEAFYFTAAIGLAAYSALGHDVPSASAAVTTAAGIDPFFNFNPVCPASDGVFRVGQRAALSLAGDQNIENYRPLINDVLIRVRTELCILESFGRETAIPFVREKGLGWVLPLHETSETYLAGVVFMVGTNFILLGSTKVVAILAIYHDLSLGLIARATGGLLGMASPEADVEKRDREFNALMDKQMAEVKGLMMDASLSRGAREERTAEVNRRYSTQLEETKESMDQRSAIDETSVLAKVRMVAGGVSVPLRLYGKASGLLRNGLEIFDTFCSRYFVAFTVTYIIVKTTHYVLFPDIFG